MQAVLRLQWLECGGVLGFQVVSSELGGCSSHCMFGLPMFIRFLRRQRSADVWRSRAFACVTSLARWVCCWRGVPSVAAWPFRAACCPTYVDSFCGAAPGCGSPLQAFCSPEHSSCLQGIGRVHVVCALSLERWQKARLLDFPQLVTAGLLLATTLLIYHVNITRIAATLSSMCVPLQLATAKAGWVLSLQHRCVHLCWHLPASHLLCHVVGATHAAACAFGCNADASLVCPCCMLALVHADTAILLCLAFSACVTIRCTV
jgi:hypothetical protein